MTVREIVIAESQELSVALQARLAADERLGIISSSSFERIVLCPGSQALSALVRNDKVPEKRDEARDSGSRIHEALAAREIDQLTDEDDRWCYSKCLEYADLLRVEVVGETPDGFTERRLYLCSGDEVLTSGAFDQMYVDRETGKALLIDYKTGYKPVTAPESNYQLRTYAVMAWYWLKRQGIELTEIHVTAVQPRASQPFARCIYDAAAIAGSLAEILYYVDAATQPDAERNAGWVQCNHCPALSTCPEAAAEATDMVESVMSVVASVAKLTEEELAEREALVPTATLAETSRAITAMEKHKKAISYELNLRISSGAEKPPGVSFIAPGKRFKVTDNYDAKQLLEEYGLSPRAAMEIFEAPSLTALGKVIAERESLSAKASEVRAKEIFEPASDMFPRDSYVQVR